MSDPVSGRVLTDRAGGADAPEPVPVSALSGAHPSRDDDPYWDYDEPECWNCGGEGYVTGCSWDWQCDTYDAGEGTCLCTRPCHICHPPKPSPEGDALRAILAQAIEARSGETRQRLDPKDESAVGETDAPEHSGGHRIAPGVTGEAAA